MENALQALDLHQSIYHFTFWSGYVLLLCIQNFTAHQFVPDWNISTMGWIDTLGPQRMTTDFIDARTFPSLLPWCWHFLFECNQSGLIFNLSVALSWWTEVQDTERPGGWSWNTGDGLLQGKGTHVSQVTRAVCRCPGVAEMGRGSKTGERGWGATGAGAESTGLQVKEIQD